jgi:hypothetical protein
MKNKFHVGDIVQWDAIGTSKEHLRVVDVWCVNEPFQLLVTDIDGESMKTSIALAHDCVLIERRDPPPRRYSSGEPMEKADQRPHKVAVDK